MVPTGSEIEELVETLRTDFGDRICGWLLTLSAVTVPSFIGNEPTVAEFLSGAYDPSEVKPTSILISYPAVKE